MITKTKYSNKKRSMRSKTKRNTKHKSKRFNKINRRTKKLVGVD